MYADSRSGNGDVAPKKKAATSHAAPASSSAQLGASTRARADPKRTVGAANAVAAGLNLSRVGIMSDRELSWIRHLAYGASAGDAAERQREAEMARRKELSDARKARWPDTTEARQEAFLRTRAEEKAEAERRKVALDELHAQQKEEERLSKMAAVELQRLRDDPRGRNAKSALMLHEAIKAREEQMAFQESVRQAQAVESEQERNAMLMEQWGHNAEELQKRLAARERNMAEKNANLEMVLFQIQQRKAQRAEEKRDGVRAKAEAAEETRENAEEEAERKARERETALLNQSRVAPKLTRSGKLQQRIEANEATEADRLRHEERLAQTRQAAVDKQARKQALFEERKRAGIDMYAAGKATDSPKRRTQDRFEGKPDSFLAKMASEDDARVQRAKANQRKQAEEAAEAASVGGSASGKNYNKAEATATGFTSLADEQAYLEEMRALPAAVRAEAAKEEAARREEAKRLAEVHKAQAAEKREQRRQEVEQAREQARRDRSRQAQDDARYRAFIESEIPEDMSPVLRAKAMQLE